MEFYHPHFSGNKQSVRKYLSEFFMLFVAVTAGFFMENIRENITERHKEKEYIISMVEDLTADTAQLNKLYIRNSNSRKGIDSLVILLDRNKAADFDSITTLAYNHIGMFYPFYSDDATMKQLLHSGGLRLITRQSVSKQIVSYYETIEKGQIQTDYLTKMLLDNFNNAVHLFPLRNNKNTRAFFKKNQSEKELYVFQNELMAYSSTLNDYCEKMKALKDKSTGLINELKKQYKLK